MSTVSVIIPCYNTGHYLAEAIQSVLDQTCQDFAIVVVDDGSTDNTAAVVKQFTDPRIHYIYQANQKLPAARNNGVAEARGEYLAFLDSDDLFLPDKLAMQARYLDEQPAVGLVASGYQFIDEAGQLLQESRSWIGRPAITLESILFGGLAPVHAMLLRRDWFDRVGGFDEQFAYCEDMDLWYRLALAGCPMEWVPGLVCQYRLHATNMSRSPEIHFAYLRRALDKAFADPRMPVGLRTRKSERSAQLDLMAAARLLAGGWESEARDHIERAIATDPGLTENDGWRLAELVVGVQSDVWSDDRLGAFTINILQDRMPALADTIATVDAKKRFYTAFSERQAGAVRQSWVDVARQDPRWLLNRGGWSILGRSFTGFR